MGGIALALFLIIALGAIGIYVLLKTLQNFQPGRRKIQKDLEEIKAQLKPYLTDLVPWSREEMEQLSLNRTNQLNKKRVVNTSRGVFTTIYHEPVIAYYYKKYVGPKENALLYAKTTEHEFIYRMKNNAVELVVNNELVGTIDQGGKLRNTKGTKLLAQVNRNSEKLLLPVLVNEKEVGSLVNPNMATKTNPRAFEFLGKMEKEEEKLFLSLAILEMVRNR